MLADGFMMRLSARNRKVVAHTTQDQVARTNWRDKDSDCTAKKYMLHTLHYYFKRILKLNMYFIPQTNIQTPSHRH